MALQLLLGSAVIIVTVAIEIIFIAVAMRRLEAAAGWFARGASISKLAIALSLLTLWLLVSLSVIIWLWTGVFIWVGAFDGLEPSLYFSIVAFTTLGFGDLILKEDHRLLSGLIAANGFIIFGLITAVLMAAITSIVEKGKE